MTQFATVVRCPECESPYEAHVHASGVRYFTCTGPCTTGDTSLWERDLDLDPGQAIGLDRFGRLVILTTLDEVTK